LESDTVEKLDMHTFLLYRVSFVKSSVMPAYATGEDKVMYWSEMG